MPLSAWQNQPNRLCRWGRSKAGGCQLLHLPPLAVRTSASDKKEWRRKRPRSGSGNRSCCKMRTVLANFLSYAFLSCLFTSFEHLFKKLVVCISSFSFFRRLLADLVHPLYKPPCVFAEQYRRFLDWSCHSFLLSIFVSYCKDSANRAKHKIKGCKSGVLIK